MKIKRLFINNYKSLVNFELVEPNAFSVFVGPNAAGKSNVFEALEFLSYSSDVEQADELFGGAVNYLNRNQVSKHEQDLKHTSAIDIISTFDEFELSSNVPFYRKNGSILPLFRTIYMPNDKQKLEPDFLSEVTKNEERYRKRIFSRIFVSNQKLVKIQSKSPHKLALDADNLPMVLRRILQDEIKQEEILEWLQFLIPEFEDLQIQSDGLSGIDTILVKEKYSEKYFTTNLLSDGSYNILALLTAIYQSDEPQFLCIEEPENGLTPYVLRSLVNFFRTVCEEKGHCIWLNTHSPTIVNELQSKELILIDKIEGVTRAKQINPDLKFKTMKLDEAWLTNTLGGGLPW